MDDHRPAPAPAPPQSLADRDAFEAAFGERLDTVLEVASWRTGEDTGAIYASLAQEVEEALKQEERIRDPIRQLVFARLPHRKEAPPGAGVYRATLEDVKQVHHSVLFSGAVEACDATRFTHDTLPLTVTQIGVSLVTYNGRLGTWVQRLFRRDLREVPTDPVDEALAVIERRDTRGGLNQLAHDDLSELARQAIMTYAERAILLKRSHAPWRMGHGNPAPYELLTGSAVTLDIFVEATRLLEELICQHQTFVFVSSEPATRDLLTLGDSLHPLEYAIVDRLSERIQAVLRRTDFSGNHTRSDTTVNGRRLRLKEWAERFRDEVASQVVVGVYRASGIAPAQVFYAHVEHAHEAALIALADSALQPHRGFPLLIDLADCVCTVTFGPESLAGPLQLAYTRAGVPLRYLSERKTRHP